MVGGRHWRWSAGSGGIRHKPTGFDANAAMNQARDEAYARAARGTNGTFGAAYE